MKKRKKRIVGLIGLTIITVMTIFATSIPDGNADAVQQSRTDTVIVKVLGLNPDIQILNIEDQEMILENSFDVKYDWENTSSVEFVVKDEDGNIVFQKTEEIVDGGNNKSGNGTTNITISEDLYGPLTIEVIATNGDETFRDIIPINRYSVKVVYVGTTAKNEPVFDIYYVDKIDNLDIDIIDPNKGPIFNPSLRYPSDDNRYYEIDPEGDF